MKMIAALATVTLFTVPVAAQEGRLSIEDRGNLTLEQSEDNSLAGTFQHGDAIARFESRVMDDAEIFKLFDEDGMQVVRVEVTNEIVTASILDDRIVAQSTRDGEQWSEVPTEPPESAPGVETLEAAIGELVQNDAYRILPNLAIELVRREIVAHEGFPAARFIHGIAVASARAQGLRMPAIRPPDGEVECADLSGDPHSDDCYGMCGNGCVCWRPVCLTCCGCEGCHTHDWSCRITNCDGIELTRLQRIGHRIGCLTFAAFYVPATPCRRYPSGSHSPPC